MQNYNLPDQMSAFFKSDISLYSMQPKPELMLTHMSMNRNIGHYKPGFAQKSADIPKFFEKLFTLSKDVINDL